MMIHLNVLYFCDEVGFCSDLLEVHLAFMRNSYKNIEGLNLPKDVLENIILPYKPTIPLPPKKNKNNSK